MAPERKIEKQLKRAIRNFHLSLDLYNNIDADSHAVTIEHKTTQVDFERWFRESLVEAYASKIPSTIQYLVDSLEIVDPWVHYVLQAMRNKVYASVNSSFASLLASSQMSSQINLSHLISTPKLDRQAFGQKNNQ